MELGDRKHIDEALAVQKVVGSNPITCFMNKTPRPAPQSPRRESSPLSGRCDVRVPFRPRQSVRLGGTRDALPTLVLLDDCRLSRGVTACELPSV